MSKPIEIKSGQKFGKLTVVSFHHKKERVYGNKKRTFCYYLCKCDCGNETIVAKDFLIRKKNPTKSCGCVSKNFLRSLTTTHGKSNTRLFRIWAHIKDRCFNVNNDAYKNYGARGIIICSEWKNNFMSFYDWAIANGYNEVLTIDRKNNNGNYEPSNCRWISVKGQHRNTRRNTFLCYNGEKKCVSEWAEILGISKETLYSRIKRGWPIERILSGK
jgi:hypothetical protein